MSRKLATAITYLSVLVHAFPGLGEESRIADSGKRRHYHTSFPAKEFPVTSWPPNVSLYIHTLSTANVILAILVFGFGVALCFFGVKKV